MLFVVGDVGIELAEVFVAEGLGFQFNEDVALEHAVVKHEIDEEVFAANENALLPGFEAEAVAHFQEKILKAIKQRVFEVGLAHGVLGAQAEELEDVGIADDPSGIEGFCSCVGDGCDFGFVFGKSAALVIEACDLAAEFADGPVAPDALDFVEAALGFVREFQQFCEVREGEPLDEVGMDWRH